MDTQIILRDYQSKIVYKDRLVLENGLGTIDVTDTISKNKIIGRKWNAQIKEKTITNTTIVKELPKIQVFAGLGGVVGNGIIAAGPKVTLKTKRDNLYNVGLSFDNNLNKYVSFGMQWKIKLK